MTTVDDPRTLYRRALALGADVIGAVRPDQMGDPTPCSELDVRGLLRHIVHDVLFVVAVGRGEDPFAGTDAGPLPDDAWPKAWAEAGAAFETAWADDATLERVVELPWSRMSGAETLISMMSMIVVHIWDVAEATAQAPAWDSGVVDAAYGSLRYGLSAEGRESDAVPFDPVVEVPDSAPTIDRLVAWAGRHP